MNNQPHLPAISQYDADQFLAAIERAALMFTEQARALGEKRDYSAIYPEADAETLNQCLAWLRGQLPAPEGFHAFNWPTLPEKARVGSATFGVGVSTRIVVEAAIRNLQFRTEFTESMTWMLVFSARKAIAEKIGVPFDAKFNEIVREVCEALKVRNTPEPLTITPPAKSSSGYDSCAHGVAGFCNLCDGSPR